MKRVLTTLSEKWPEYLLEIIVLIIGIYGAFVLDNWNEDRMNEEAIRKIIQQVDRELEKDIQYSNSMIEYGNQLDSLADLVLSNTPTLEEYRGNPNLRMVGLQYVPIKFTYAGYNKLKNFQDIIPEGYSEVTDRIFSFYEESLAGFEELYHDGREIINARHSELEQHSWYFDFLNGNVTPEIHNYFKSDPHYRNRIARFKNALIIKTGSALDFCRQSGLITRIYIGEALQDTSFKSMIRPILGPQNYLDRDTYTGLYKSTQSGFEMDIIYHAGYLHAYAYDQYWALVWESDSSVLFLNNPTKLTFLGHPTTKLMFINEGDTTELIKIK